ncbi:MAG TPA: ferritin family protein [Terracidiphilus sp.]|nr:ferritin family protein [Terracidiphilus sp.]
MGAILSDMGIDTTIQNLLAAYRGELTARARYLAFATKAEADGHRGIASLFRAAARAEQIHANSQARVLRQMGANPATDISPCDVRDTLENLKSALSGENYEIDSVYPTFIEEATARINSNAARSFVWALEAEKTHARLYAEAILLLESESAGSWVAEARHFYVCPVCACTSEELAEDNCTICNYPSERAEAIC